jgi:hypothetical protein
MRKVSSVVITNNKYFVGLIRADYLPNLQPKVLLYFMCPLFWFISLLNDALCVQEAEALLAMAMDTYVTDKPCSEFLMQFNKTPNEFDFNKCVEHFKAEYGEKFA